MTLRGQYPAATAPRAMFLIRLEAAPETLKLLNSPKIRRSIIESREFDELAVKRVVNDFYELAQRRDSQNVFFFGAGEIGLRTAKKFFQPDWTVDNSPSLWGGSYGQLDDIRSPESIRGYASSAYFVICSAAEDEITRQLFEFGVDKSQIFLSPYAKSIGPSIRLTQLEANLLVGSAGPADEESNQGGGLYNLQIEGDEVRQTKILSGQCHGIVDWQPGFALASTDAGLYAVDKLTLEVALFAELPKGVRPHGLTWNPDLGRVNVIANNKDALLSFNSGGELVAIDYLLRGDEHNTAACHHMNDIAYSNGALYVSMFSFTGSWKLGVYDGGIYAFDAKSFSPIGSVVSGAQMPHSVTFDDEQLWFCDSLPGMLTRGQQDFKIGFPTFCRGLSFVGDLMFVGASRNRNALDAPVESGSQVRDVASGVYVSSKTNRMARFIPMKGSVPEIHCVFSLLDEVESTA